MMKKFRKYFLMAAVCACLFFSVQTSYAAEVGETAESAEQEESGLGFTIGTFEYRIIPEATQEDMPPGFTLGDWEYHGNKVSAGFTENSDMVCVMGEDQETGYSYRFIYDPGYDMFVPYFGTEIKDGYIYTIPMYEGVEVPYGFVEGYYVIQTVPMFVFQREDAELTTEEIALGILSEDAYLVFLMMNEKGEEICYTYDLVDRTFQRSMLQERDAEKVTEVNETADKLHADISKLNADMTKRMNGRLMIIGILAAVVFIMTGVIINLLLKISRLKKEGIPWAAEEGAEESEASEEEFFDDEVLDEDDFEDEEEETSEEEEALIEDEDDELEIFDLDDLED